MAWKYVLLSMGVSVAAIAYWLYTPLPNGYSSTSAIKIQLFLAAGKVINLMVCVLLVFVLLHASR